MEPLWVEAGDTFFTRSSSLLGRLIRWGEREEGEEPTETNHTGVVVESGWVVPPAGAPFMAAKPAVVVEALWKTRRGPLSLDGLTWVRVFRPVPSYDELELEHFRHEAESFVGNTYGWWKLAGFLVKRFTKGRVDPTRWYFMKDRPICSFLAAHVNQAAQSVQRILTRIKDRSVSKFEDTARFPFGMPPQAADPDEMMDYALANPGEWQEVK
jgi:hypothetical protein